jgi:hypothetical protein
MSAAFHSFTFDAKIDADREVVITHVKAARQRE